MYNKEYYHKNKERINANRKSKYIHTDLTRGPKHKVNYTDETKLKVIELFKQKLKYKDICAQTKLNYHYVKKILNAEKCLL